MYLTSINISEMKNMIKYSYCVHLSDTNHTSFSNLHAEEDYFY